MIIAEELQRFLSLSPDARIHEIGVFVAPETQTEMAGHDWIEDRDLSAALPETRALRAEADPALVVIENCPDDCFAYGAVGRHREETKSWIIDSRSNEHALLLLPHGDVFVVWGHERKIRVFRIATE
jgi:hypothetical protein